jgi:hypothetical protein
MKKICQSAIFKPLEILFWQICRFHTPPTNMVYTKVYTNVVLDWASNGSDYTHSFFQAKRFLRYEGSGKFLLIIECYYLIIEN